MNLGGEKLTDKIVERENRLLEEIGKLRETHMPVYIYGYNIWARQLERILSKNGMSHNGFIVNKEYYDENSGEILCLEDVLEKESSKVNIIVGFLRYNPEKLTPYQDKINKIINCDVSFGNPTADSEYMTYEWFMNHSDKLQNIYDKLSDDLSKRTLEAYINQKISLKYGYLSAVKSEELQYFEKDLIKFREGEVFVDCGAYDGDTAISFIQALKEQNINSYDSIISFEPDEENFKKLCSRNIRNHVCVEAGVSDKTGKISFDSDDASGVICDNGESFINIDTIDNVLDSKKATFIKMDIEGAEMDALKGGKDTIQKYKPILAICIYHKKQDLFEIPDYIHTLVPEYKLYIRAYCDNCNELVLYAVYPEEMSAE